MATYNGEYGVYHWIQTTAIYLDHVVRSVPEAFLGKFVAITAFDCGPFHPRAERVKAVLWYLTLFRPPAMIGSVDLYAGRR